MICLDVEVDCFRETKNKVITFGEMLDLNRETENKIQLGGGFTTDSKYKIIFKHLSVQFSKSSSFPGGVLRPGLWE